jgi:hypothetical protein
MMNNSIFAAASWGNPKGTRQNTAPETSPKIKEVTGAATIFFLFIVDVDFF